MIKTHYDHSGIKPAPIIIIGAGGIVHDAHLPAYRQAGWEVAGIYDVNNDKAEALAAGFSIPRVFHSMQQLLAEAPPQAIFDVAVPGSSISAVLQQLPEHASVLMQKPMGENISQAKEVLQITRNRHMIAAVNFQLRYAPFIVAARDILKKGWIGTLCDIEVNVNVFTPWHLWSFLNDAPRVEILYHSIHYIDLVRSFLGNPEGLYAKTVKHPMAEKMASVKSTVIMDYGDMVRAVIHTNHNHIYGLQHQHAYIRLEGTKGAIRIKTGALINYPAGVPDEFEYAVQEEGKPFTWKSMPIKGSWFPDAFIGSMGELMKAAEGTGYIPDNSVEDIIYTMACVEAAYASSDHGATKWHL